MFVKDGDNGTDGKDSKADEFIFKGVNNISNYNQSINRPYSSPYVDDYAPAGWTDDPTGPNPSEQYEWVCKRSFVTSTQKWSEFSIPSLWSRYAKDGGDTDLTQVATPYMAGEWKGSATGSGSSSVVYFRNQYVYPVVSWLEGPLNKPLYYFIKRLVVLPVGSPSPQNDPTNWQLADGFEMIIAEAFIF